MIEETMSFLLFTPSQLPAQAPIGAAAVEVLTVDEFFLVEDEDRHRRSRWRLNPMICQSEVFL